jgi:glycosyltransferase involved in cell wall biosynthesis
MRVAYVMSRFPKITETFVLREILEMERLGLHVDIMPLIRERAAVRHAEIDALMPRVRFRSGLAPGTWRAVLHFLLRRPGALIGVVRSTLAMTRSSPRLLAKGLILLPKSIRFAFEAERDGIDHVHAHFATHPALAAFVIGRLAGIPFSFTGHGSDIHVDQTGLDRKLEACAFAIMISDYNKAFVAERCGGEEKMHVIRCGVDVDEFAPPAREPEPAGDRPLRIICVAALREVKGHRHLIDACARLRERSVTFECRLVGDGPLRSSLEARVRSAGLDDRVSFLGALPRSEVLALLRRSDVAVLASVTDEAGRREGIPVSLMEAMACELPVVASRQSGIPELVEDGVGGLLVEPGDAAGLAEALARLAEDPGLRRALGAAGRACIRTSYDLRRNAARLAALFRREEADPSAAVPADGGRTARPQVDVPGRV